MQKVLLSLAILALLTSEGSISQAAALSEKQMDSVSAGYIIAIPIAGCDCYFYIRPQPGPPGTMTPMLQTPTSSPPLLDPGNAVPELFPALAALK
jgi:hypothetical protein